ncbi:MAG: hypothetical protein JWN44_6700 [Myxococcales bacterium]|nr:hypothetical protein [Myxococcales bacterium]
MTRVLLAAALIAGLTRAAAAAAPTPDERKVARAHYDKAVNHFNAAEYVAAADEFQAVYRIVSQPALLYDAGQAMRLAGEKARAVELYQTYLKVAPPEAAQRPEVEKRLKDLTPNATVAVAVDKTRDKPATPTAADKTMVATGNSDRVAAVAEAIKTNRPGFRGCFDKWSKSHPGVSGRVTLTLYLDPEGNMDQPDADTKGFEAADVSQCIEDFARTLKYPRSPSGKFTRFTYPFDFKAVR